MVHPHAKLTPFGRLLLVQRILVFHWPVRTAAASLGVSRATAYTWLARWRAEGEAGLVDRSSRPHVCPGALNPAQVARILTVRRHLRVGPHRLAPVLGRARSTIYAVLRRHGLSRLRDLDRASGVPVRYVRDRPGELLHLDMKPLGRIPAGGGHQIWGRASGTPRARGAGADVVHVAVDDTSRLAFVQVLADSRGPTAAQFLVDAAAFFAEQGIQIERVLTDRGKTYTASRAFQATVARLGIRHKVTRPYRPQTNGKAERFIQTLVQEWAYARLYTSTEERTAALPNWVHHYNHHRLHTALGGRPPMAVASVNNVCGNHT